MRKLHVTLPVGTRPKDGDQFHHFMHGWTYPCAPGVTVAVFGQWRRAVEIPEGLERVADGDTLRKGDLFYSPYSDAWDETAHPGFPAEDVGYFRKKPKAASVKHHYKLKIGDWMCEEAVVTTDPTGEASAWRPIKLPTPDSRFLVTGDRLTAGDFFFNESTRAWVPALGSHRVDDEDGRSYCRRYDLRVGKDIDRTITESNFLLGVYIAPAPTKEKDRYRWVAVDEEILSGDLVYPIGTSVTIDTVVGQKCCVPKGFARKIRFVEVTFRYKDITESIGGLWFVAKVHGGKSLKDTPLGEMFMTPVS